MNYTALFFRYLKENGIYKQFIANELESIVRGFFHIPQWQFPSIINDSLSWCDTNEGFDFWYDEDIRFKDFANKILYP